MALFDMQKRALAGPAGLLHVPDDDEITYKLAMLIEGECEGAGPIQTAEKFGYSKARYFQIRAAYRARGSKGLSSQKRGPKTNYRRTPEVVRQVIRHRFLDPDASAEVIAQKLHQSGLHISIRSVERIIADYGLQKKTPHLPPASGSRAVRRAGHQGGGTAGRRRSAKHRARRPPTTGR